MHKIYGRRVADLMTWCEQSKLNVLVLDDDVLGGIAIWVEGSIEGRQ